MSKDKPAIPKGTRDFNPQVVVKRNYIFSTIRKTFEKFGYQPLETPAMENLSVLTGKYGEEGDQLIFKILNSGDYLAKTAVTDFEQGSKSMLRKISEKALRYDLTVPFARFVVMNRNEITFPFKRYQIQPVWRADRPQRGRYREFYQCDADVVGTKSLLCEAEIVLMIDEVLSNLGITDFSIKINHRGILAGIAEAIGQKGREVEICVAIDKLDKIGQEGVNKELSERGVSDDSIAALQPILNLKGDSNTLISSLDNILENSAEGKRGLDEIKEVFKYLSSFQVKNAALNLDIALARGLSYYTGCIFEVKVNNATMGSISGGGRYDNLTGMFGLPDVSGVGFSFGVDRIYDVMEELNLFQASNQTITQLLISNFDKASEEYSLPLLQQFRNAGIATELYPEAAKLKKQMTYADQKKIPFVLLVGSEEMQTGLLQLKNMQTGEQMAVVAEGVIAKLLEI
ncbi:histidine--tRNA ligase [Adhaeribacter rhizoryzae]|uniref:Histidine--tRNA ligase n=1 Tax=Adhaeribacter rhizoryzae TaxID=2607907 RepID=A0A5M6DB14_9BACT|nr:histidine--tRNA ligase [Adhaeribacter rhizoryzae]KAA5544737.1 histidine--tRNA ligase [Adhaeribacter rhizoryzae]